MKTRQEKAWAKIKRQTQLEEADVYARLEGMSVKLTLPEGVEETPEVRAWLDQCEAILTKKIRDPNGLVAKHLMGEAKLPSHTQPTELECT